MSRKAIVVGCRGQDGSLLWSQLSKLGYELIGVSRTGLIGAPEVAESQHFDIMDAAAVARLIRSVRPDEIYFLAAHHNSSEEHVDDLPALFRHSLDVNTLAVVNFLDAIRCQSPTTRLFFAASSHVFGAPSNPVQDESTPFNPDSAYGISKAAGIFACRHYRRHAGVFASCGILYNHESWLRPEKFVARKIAVGVARIKKGLQRTLALGNLDAEADWGYAPDFTNAMRLMLVADRADDFVVATGKAHTVRDFVRIAFEAVALDYRRYVESDPTRARARSNGLVGNASRLAAATGWRPSIEFADMVCKLVARELGTPDTGTQP